MVFKTPPIKIFVLLGWFLFITSYSSAQSDSSSLSVQTFIQDGLKAYERHDIRKAVDHFSRALLLDSTDKTAREHLTLINALDDQDIALIQISFTEPVTHTSSAVNNMSGVIFISTQSILFSLANVMMS